MLKTTSRRRIVTLYGDRPTVLMQRRSLPPTSTFGRRILVSAREPLRPYGCGLTVPMVRVAAETSPARRMAASSERWQDIKRRSRAASCQQPVRPGGFLLVRFGASMLQYRTFDI